jgi:hypothetical protein
MGSEALTDTGLPTVETGCQHNAGVIVAFADLSEEVGNRASATPTEPLLKLDECVRPPHQAGRGFSKSLEV